MRLVIWDRIAPIVTSLWCYSMKSYVSTPYSLFIQLYTRLLKEEDSDCTVYKSLSTVGHLVFVLVMLYQLVTNINHFKLGTHIAKYVKVHWNIKKITKVTFVFMLFCSKIWKFMNASITTSFQEFFYAIIAILHIRSGGCQSICSLV